MAETSGLINCRDASASSGGPKWHKPVTVIPVSQRPPPQGLRPSGNNPFSFHGLGSQRNKQRTIGGQRPSRILAATRHEETQCDGGGSLPTMLVEVKAEPQSPKVHARPMGTQENVSLYRQNYIKSQAPNKSIFRPGVLDSRIDSQTSLENEHNLGSTQAMYLTASSSASSKARLNPAAPQPSADSTSSLPASVASVPREPGPNYDHQTQTQTQQSAHTIMDENQTPSSPASAVSVDPNDYEPPDYEYQKQMTRAEHHFRQAGFIYKTLLWKNQQLESELVACRKELEEFKQNRTLVKLTAARRDSTFTPAFNNCSHSKSVSELPEQAVGVKRSFQECQSSDELNIGPREPVSPSHPPWKYRFSKNNKPTQEERKLGFAPGGKYTISMDETYGGNDAWSSIEDYNSDREPRYQETRGNIQRIIAQLENFGSSQNTGPKLKLREIIHTKKKAKNIKPKGQSKNHLKFNPGPQPMNVNSEPSKRDATIRDPIATSITLQRSEQQGVPLKRVRIEHSEISGKDSDHINVDNSDDEIKMPSPVKKRSRAVRMRG